MQFSDDRTPKEKTTHHMGVVAVDKALSGWGPASGGLSSCAWAYDPVKHNGEKILWWVLDRPEMVNVRVVDLDQYRPSSKVAHFHIYSVADGHPALT